MFVYAIMMHKSHKMAFVLQINIQGLDTQAKAKSMQKEIDHPIHYEKKTSSPKQNKTSIGFNFLSTKIRALKQRYRM